MKNRAKITIFFLTITLLPGCLLDGGKFKASSSRVVDNQASTLSPNHGRILEDNPIILSGNYNLNTGVDFNSLLTFDSTYITSNQFLIGGCSPTTGISLSSCFQVYKDQISMPLTKNEGTWGYDANSEEFLQVNTYGHIARIIAEFQNVVSHSYSTSRGVLGTSIPNGLISNYGFWYVNTPAGYNVNNIGKTLLSYSNGDVEDNAYFNPAKFTLTFGSSSQINGLKFAQDPTVIYHEVGHALQKIMINARNMTSNATGGTTTRSDIGTLTYDEGNAVAEGISDYFSFMMNKRTHIGEWALGRFFNLSRPMTESDPAHDIGIDTTPESRLSYPRYVHYEVKDPLTPCEDVHCAGQIISHYLVALTRDLQDKCLMSETYAIRNVLYTLYETLAELGDLTAKGVDGGVDQVNLNSTHSGDWIKKVNPINFRRFSQGMARHLYLSFNQTLNCAGSSYHKDYIEDLLDQYGLLLFKTYNINGNQNIPETVVVDEANRVQTQFAQKSSLTINPNAQAPKAYVFDGQADMADYLADLLAYGVVNPSDLTSTLLIDRQLSYNNGNGKISPGEVVGIALNLYNNSGVALGGVQVLANDWDHIDDTTLSPCKGFSEEPSFLSGAEGTTANTCAATTPDNGTTAGDIIFPTCLVQINDTNYSYWGTQDKLKASQGLPDNKCLGGSGASKYDCYIRAIKGVDHAFFAKIDPQKTWSQTVSKKDGTFPGFGVSNLLLFEINPWTPPGTNVTCRFRTRFSNCEDCFHDAANANDDYKDFEYSGNKPFKVITLNFKVID